MNLSSDRLLYSKIIEQDKKDVTGWYTDSQVMQLVTGKALSQLEADTKFNVILTVNKNDTEGYFAVRLKSTNQFIGIAKYTSLDIGVVEVGYGMMPLFWGVGYGSEILKALITSASKDHTVHTLKGIVNKENHASVKILKKHGFVFERSSDDLKTEYFIKKNYLAAADGIC